MRLIVDMNLRRGAARGVSVALLEIGLAYQRWPLSFARADPPSQEHV